MVETLCMYGCLLIYVGYQFARAGAYWTYWALNR
jgi:hypothetical protein